MNRWLFAVTLGLILSNSAAVQAEAAKPKSGDWLTDYPKARELARQTGKPLCVVFR